MVEKAGHKKRVMIARNQYISEGKPKDTTADNEVDDIFGDSTSRPTGPMTTPPMETGRPKTPEGNRDVPDDDDLYDATPRPSRPIVPIRNDVPEEDDLEALIAEAEGRDKQKGTLTQTEPDDDDIDALMAESDRRDMTKKPASPGPNPDDDDLDALMAEAESQDQNKTTDGQGSMKNSINRDSYEDEEAAMQEMDGLW